MIQKPELRAFLLRVGHLPCRLLKKVPPWSSTQWHPQDHFGKWEKTYWFDFLCFDTDQFAPLLPQLARFQIICPKKKWIFKVTFDQRILRSLFDKVLRQMINTCLILKSRSFFLSRCPNILTLQQKRVVFPPCKCSGTVCCGISATTCQKNCCML